MEFAMELCTAYFFCSNPITTTVTSSLLLTHAKYLGVRKVTNTPKHLRSQDIRVLSSMSQFLYEPLLRTIEWLPVIH